MESSVDRTWGKGFNEDGGGIVVMKWTDEGIEMWQFRKGTEPLDLSVEGEEVDPETWGVVSTRESSSGYIEVSEREREKRPD